MKAKIKDVYIMKVISATAIIDGEMYGFTYNLSEGYFYNSKEDLQIEDDKKRYEIEGIIEEAVNNGDYDELVWRL